MLVQYLWRTTLAVGVLSVTAARATNTTASGAQNPTRVLASVAQKNVEPTVEQQAGMVTVRRLDGRPLSSHAWYWTQSKFAGVDGRGNVLMYIWRTNRIELRVHGEYKAISVADVRSVAFFWERNDSGLSLRRTVMTLRTGEVIDGRTLEAWSDNKRFAQVHVVMPELNERIEITSVRRLTDVRTFDRAPREIGFVQGH
jgi:hypothetical protein